MKREARVNRLEASPHLVGEIPIGSLVACAAPQPKMSLDHVGDIPATAHISLVSTLPGLLALEKGWRTLESAANTPTSVFQSFEWIAAWSKTYCATLDGQELHIIAGYQITFR